MEEGTRKSLCLVALLPFPVGPQGMDRHPLCSQVGQGAQWEISRRLPSQRLGQGVEVFQVLSGGGDGCVGRIVSTGDGTPVTQFLLQLWRLVKAAAGPLGFKSWLPQQQLLTQGYVPDPLAP